MHAFLLLVATLISLVQGHGVILAAAGISGNSVGYSVDESIARNCTLISPCQQDTSIIRDAEISANTTGVCGRTELDGNIDIPSSIESAIATGDVTQVSVGTTLTVTIHQVNQDGAGPYTCDLFTSTDATTAAATLQVINNVPGTNGLSLSKFTDYNMTVIMPTNYTCSSGSTGNICTVRCRNAAQAGPFGGCFAVEQTA